MITSSNALKAYFFLTVTTLCWGGNAVFGRLAVGEVSPMLLTSLRWLGAVLLLMVFANRPIRQDWPVARRHWKYLFAMGALGFTFFNALFYVAAHTTTAVNIGILQGSMPAIVLVGIFLFYKTRVTPPQMAGVAVTMVGVVIVGIGGDLARLADLELNEGDIIMMIACVLYSGYTVGLRRRPDISALGLFTALAVAALVASIPLFAFEIYSGNVIWPTPKAWIVIAMITLLPSFTAQIFFIKGVERIGPGRAGVFINLVPVFASVFAVAYLGEPFEMFHAIALTMVLGGIWLSEKGKPA